MTTITTVEPLWALWLARVIVIGVCGVSAYAGGKRIAPVIQHALSKILAAIDRDGQEQRQHIIEVQRFFAESRQREAAKMVWMQDLKETVAQLEQVPSSVGSIREDVATNSAIIRDLAGGITPLKPRRVVKKR